MHWIVVGIGILVVLVIAGVVVHSVLVWADRRGYVWYRNADRPAPRSLGMLEQIYQPSVEHIVEHETSEETRADRAQSGDPEHPGGDG